MRPILNVLIHIITLLSIAGLFVLSASSNGTSNLYVAYLAISSIILTSLFPKLALASFLFILPIFGNKPGTEQSLFLLILGMSLQVGLSLSILIKRPANNRVSPLLPGFWYLAISVLSIFPVSYQIFWNWFRSSQSNIFDFSLLKWNAASILLSREDDPSYPIFSVFWTALSFSLLYFTALLSFQNSKARALFCWALLSGFLCSLIAGLLNYYGFINLDALRGLDPVVNPGGTQYRLQSWFGHSGWFAEYVTMLAPFSMLILTLSIPYWTRVSALLLLLLVGEIVLILTFQRGGWLSYPLTLIAVWTSIYVLRKLDRGDRSIFHALKSSALKILISLPLTLIISFMFLKTFGSQFGMDQYTDRFKDISKASDRSEFIRAGFALGVLNPILGQGSESFAIQYRREYRNQDGMYFGQIDLPLHGTAHNLYAQTFAGKGALGLLSLLVIMFVAVKRGCKFVFSYNSKNSRNDQVIALASICSILACFIYGFVQELFYVQSLQYTFFAVSGILAGLSLEDSENQNKLSKSNKHITLCLVFLFITHIVWHSQKGRTYSDSSGCFNEESNSNGERWRWCGLRSSIDIDNSNIENKILTLEAAPAQHAKIKKRVIKVEACNQTIFSKELMPSERASFTLKNLNCKEEKTGFTRINAYSGEYFIPAKENEASNDRRVLALRWIMQN